MAQVHYAFDARCITYGIPNQLSQRQLIDAFPTVSKPSITARAAKVRDLLNANTSGRARYDRILAEETFLPHAERDDLLKSIQGTGSRP